MGSKHLQVLKQKAEQAAAVALAAAAQAEHDVQEAQQQLVEARRQICDYELSTGCSAPNSGDSCRVEGNDTELPTLEQLARIRDNLQVVNYVCESQSVKAVPCDDFSASLQPASIPVQLVSMTMRPTLPMQRERKLLDRQFNFSRQDGKLIKHQVSSHAVPQDMVRILAVFQKAASPSCKDVHCCRTRWWRNLRLCSYAR
jgi:hypothetical protein